jgi:hypothetical protein
MATKGKRKTTMAKLAREGKLREQRAFKKAKKDARKLGPPAPPEDSIDTLDVDDDAVDGAPSEGSPEESSPQARPLADVAAEA